MKGLWERAVTDEAWRGLPKKVMTARRWGQRGVREHWRQGRKAEKQEHEGQGKVEG